MSRRCPGATAIWYVAPSMAQSVSSSALTTPMYGAKRRARSIISASRRRAGRSRVLNRTWQYRPSSLRSRAEYVVLFALVEFYVIDGLGPIIRTSRRSTAGHDDRPDTGA